MHLACTKCGGPLPAQAASSVVTCPYCGTTSVPAPRVIEHYIGRRAPMSAEVLPPEPPRLPCPRCAGYLTEKEIRGSALAGCKNCGGVWLDAATVDRLRSARDEEISAAAKRFNGFELSSLPLPDQDVPVACPVCSAHLRRVPLQGTAHSVDVCDAHGTWFDRCKGDELEMFVRAFEDARAGVVGPSDGAGSGGKGGGFFARFFRPG